MSRDIIFYLHQGGDSTQIQHTHKHTHTQFIPSNTKTLKFSHVFTLRENFEHNMLRLFSQSAKSIGRKLKKNTKRIKKTKDFWKLIKSKIIYFLLHLHRNFLLLNIIQGKWNKTNSKMFCI